MAERDRTGHNQVQDGGHILVVDDQPENLRLLSRMLERQGHDVWPAPSGAMALDVMTRRRPDLVLLDIRMPKMDGFEVCKRMKADRSLRDIPVIFISALAETEDKIKAFRAGGVDYITKPFREAEVLARATTHLVLGRLRKKTENDLHQVRNKYQEIFNAANEAIIICDAGSTDILDVNQAALDMTGYSRGEMLELKARDLSRSAPPNSREEMMHQIKATAAEGPRMFEWRVRKKNGEIVWGEVTLKKSMIADREVIIFAARDISARKRVEKTLEKSEKKFRTLFQSAPNPISISRLEDGKIIDCNQAVTNILGFEREELVGKTVAEVNCYVDPTDRARLKKRLQADGEVHGLEIRLRRKDGKIRLAAFSGAVMNLDGEKVFLAALRDLTDQKAIEEKYRRIFENLQDGYIWVDMEGSILLANNVAARILRCDLSELTRRNFFRDVYYTPRDRDNLIEKLLKDGSVSNFEVELKRKDGKKVIIDISSHIIYENGAPASMESTFRDVTDRKEIEAQLARLASVVEQSDDCILIVDAGRKIEYVNPAFETLTGYASTEAIGRDPFAFRGGKRSRELEEEIWRTISSGRSWRGNMTNRKKDGSLIEEHAAIFPVFDNRGEIINYTAIKRDVTEQKKVEKLLHQARKMEAIGALAGGIAHDFNNILSPILCLAEFAMEHITEPEELKEDLDEILQAAERAADLVKHILSFSRGVDQGKKPLTVSVVVKEAVKLLRASIPATIEIKQEIQSREQALAEPTHIHQIVMNLGANAYHAMRERGGVLGVSLEDVEFTEANPAPGLPITPGRYLHLRVADTGHGMEKQILEKIFEPYFTTKEVGEGTGLGLAVVHGIVKDCDGYIQAYSEPGQGTTFHVYLPIVNREAAASRPIKERESLIGGEERIMVVDDEEKILRTLEKVLSAQGYGVAAFGNGLQALAEFKKRSNRYDLIITDMTMPYMNGAEFSRRILEIRPDIPIILCTGHSELVDRNTALDMGIREYFEKPLVIGKLLKTIRNVLD